MHRERDDGGHSFGQITPETGRMTGVDPDVLVEVERIDPAQSTGRRTRLRSVSNCDCPVDNKSRARPSRSSTWFKWAATSAAPYSPAAAGFSHMTTRIGRQPGTLSNIDRRCEETGNTAPYPSSRSSRSFDMLARVRLAEAWGSIMMAW